MFCGSRGKPSSNRASGVIRPLRGFFLRRPQSLLETRQIVSPAPCCTVATACDADAARCSASDGISSTSAISCMGRLLHGWPRKPARRQPAASAPVRLYSSDTFFHRSRAPNRDIFDAVTHCGHFSATSLRDARSRPSGSEQTTRQCKGSGDDGRCQRAQRPAHCRGAGPDWQGCVT